MYGDMCTGEATVLDCGNQIFTSAGEPNEQEVADAANAAQPAMQRLLQQLVHARVPVPAVLRIDKVACLILSHDLGLFRPKFKAI